MYVQPYFIEGLQSPEQEVRELAAAQVERLASDKSALQALVCACACACAYGCPCVSGRLRIGRRIIGRVEKAEVLSMCRGGAWCVYMCVRVCVRLAALGVQRELGRVEEKARCRCGVDACDFRRHEVIQVAALRPHPLFWRTIESMRSYVAC